MVGSGLFGTATNLVVAPVWNNNAAVKILRECLYKCLLSWEEDSRRRGLFLCIGSFTHE